MEIFKEVMITNTIILDLYQLREFMQRMGKVIVLLKDYLLEL